MNLRRPGERLQAWVKVKPPRSSSGASAQVSEGSHPLLQALLIQDSGLTHLSSRRPTHSERGTQPAPQTWDVKVDAGARQHRGLARDRSPGDRHNAIYPRTGGARASSPQRRGAVAPVPARPPQAGVALGRGSRKAQDAGSHLDPPHTRTRTRWPGCHSCPVTTSPHVGKSTRQPHWVLLF